MVTTKKTYNLPEVITKRNGGSIGEIIRQLRIASNISDVIRISWRMK